MNQDSDSVCCSVCCNVCCSVNQDSDFHSDDYFESHLPGNGLQHRDVSLVVHLESKKFEYFFLARLLDLRGWYARNSQKRACCSIYEMSIRLTFENFCKAAKIHARCAWINSQKLARNSYHYGVSSASRIN